MSPDVVVIADDLTGAGDTAVQFTAAGWSTELQLHPADSSAEVVALTTDSRALSAERAAQRVAATARAVLERGGGPRIYKKIDSTLRGPVRAEVEAVLGVLGDDIVAVVCPAFPAVGRTVVDGTLRVDGVPVARTGIGEDPVTPVRQSHLPTLLDAPLVRLDPGSTPCRWASDLRSAGRLVVVDAATDEDLHRVARAITELRGRALAVGSGGLAAPLARLWRPAAASATVLVLVSSLHERSRGQSAAIAAAGAQCHRPTAPELQDDAAWEGFVRRVLEAVRDTCPATVLVTTPEPAEMPLVSEAVAGRLAALAARLARTGEVGGLVVVGGDGARALLAGLGATGIELVGSVAPGVPLGTLVDGEAAGMPIATKAGGFGEEHALVTAAEAVRTMRRSAR